MTLEATLAYARRRDEADPLRAYRTRFALPRDASGAELVYLAGHSLGLLPLAARALISEELDDWGRLGVLGHESARRPWIPYHENLTAGLRHLTGGTVHEVVAMNSLTVNLHLMLASFYRPTGQRTKILMEGGAFSSDRHAIASQIAWHGLDPGTTLIELPPTEDSELISEDAIEACLDRSGAEIALVLWPGVQFRTGQAFDIARIARSAHRAGCLVGVDLAHSIGNLPLALHESEVDFAVWCSYKYLNAGPGAIGGCFIHERHASTRPHLCGWWGHEAATRFDMRPQFRAAAGAAGWQISNPPILATAPLIASLDIFQEARIERLREKSVALTAYLEFLLARMGPAVRVISPGAPTARGCQLSFRITGRARGSKVFERLVALGVACDWRAPDSVRVAPVPLYNGFEDVFRFSERLAQAVRESA